MLVLYVVISGSNIRLKLQTLKYRNLLWNITPVSKLLLLRAVPPQPWRLWVGAVVRALKRIFQMPSWVARGVPAHTRVPSH